MNRLLAYICVIGFAHGAPPFASGQERAIPPCSTTRGDARVEEQTVHDLLRIWQRETNPTVRRKAADTLQQMAGELLPIFVCNLNREIQLAVANGPEAGLHMETVEMLTVVIGRVGNSASRDNDVAKALIAVAGGTKEMPMRVRRCAIESLGRVYANRSIFLILDREAFWLRERLKQATPRDMAEELKNEAATLKDKFQLRQPISAEQALRLTVETRLAAMRVMRYRKVITLLSELEEAQEKDLSLRIWSNFAGLEDSLHFLATMDREKGKDAPEKIAAAAAKAESHATALYADIAKTSDNVWHWQDLNQSTAEVIAALRGLLDDPEPQLRYASAAAIGRLYGKSE